MDDPIDLSKVIKKVNDTYAVVAQLAMSHEMLRSWSNDSFDECIKKIAANNEETNAKIGGLVEGIKKITQDIAWCKNDINTKYRLFTDGVSLIKDQLNELLKQYQDLKLSVENVDKKIYALHNTTNVAATANINKVKTELENKINSIPIPQDVVNIQQVIGQIEKQIEPTRRDTNTATTNINAHATRLMLLEKKMENALSQLKYLERYQ